MNLKKILCMAMVDLPSATVNPMKAFTLMIKNMDMEFSLGLMGNAMKVGGQMVNKMDLGY